MKGLEGEKIIFEKKSNEGKEMKLKGRCLHVQHYYIGMGVKKI